MLTTELTLEDDGMSYLQCLKTETVVMMTVCIQVKRALGHGILERQERLTTQAHEPAIAHPILC
jgi:hypothetical protein